MNIRLANASDRDSLFDVWIRSVEATHSFVSRDDVAAIIPHVREYLAGGPTEFWVVCSDSGSIMGFMGMLDNVMESLFLAPEFHRRGAGSRLVQHAQAQHGELYVDVNEQNSSAVSFYQSCGFALEGRSELDGEGRPYPLLHMRWVRPTVETREIQATETSRAEHGSNRREA